jgi:hypothetical protein
MFTSNSLNAELKPNCHLLALLGAHHIFHVRGVRVKMITLNQNLYWNSNQNISSTSKINF